MKTPSAPLPDPFSQYSFSLQQLQGHNLSGLMQPVPILLVILSSGPFFFPLSQQILFCIMEIKSAGTRNRMLCTKKKQYFQCDGSYSCHNKAYSDWSIFSLVQPHHAPTPSRMTFEGNLEQRRSLCMH